MLARAFRSDETVEDRPRTVNELAVSEKTVRCSRGIVRVIKRDRVDDVVAGTSITMCGIELSEKKGKLLVFA